MVNFAPNLYECPNCSLISADFPAIPELYDEHYLETYRKLAQEPLSDLLMRCRWGLVRRHLNGHKTLLDYGTGTGVFLENALRPQDLSVKGYDVNPASPFSRVMIDHLRPDVLTMFDVVEHLTDPKGVIEKINPRLLTISTPNVDFVDTKNLSTWRHFKPGEHLHYFGRKALTALMLSTGFAVEEMSFTEAAKRNPDRPFDIITMVGAR